MLFSQFAEGYVAGSVVSAVVASILSDRPWRRWRRKPKVFVPSQAGIDAAIHLQSRIAAWENRPVDWRPRSDPRLQRGAKCPECGSDCRIC